VVEAAHGSIRVFCGLARQQCWRSWGSAHCLGATACVWNGGRGTIHHFLFDVGVRHAGVVSAEKWERNFMFASVGVVTAKLGSNARINGRKARPSASDASE